MSKELTTFTSPGQIIEAVITQGDLAKLSSEDRTRYYTAVCESIGLNPLTKPFEYITLNGKLTLYARKDATDQLRSLRGVSVVIVSRERLDDVYLVTAHATTADGRTDESIGAVSIAGLKGKELANAYMTAESKAKRRVTLSICGLGMLDESELETIPGAAPVRQPGPPAPPVRQIAPAPQESLETLGEVVNQEMSEETLNRFGAMIDALLESNANKHVSEGMLADDAWDAARKTVREWLERQAEQQLASLDDNDLQKTFSEAQARALIARFENKKNGDR